jgi:hypothetical protein
MRSCVGKLFPLLLLLLAVAASWAFAVREVGAEEGLEPAAVCNQSCQGDRFYGSSQNQFDSAPAVHRGDRITALNLAETIYDKEQRQGTALEAAADLLGPPLLPVTGIDEVSDSVALALQEQYEAHEATEPRRPGDALGPLIRKTEFQKVAEAVAEQSMAAAEPRPPKLTPLDDLLPARVWTPVFEGCSPKFVDARCNYQKPNPRLFVTNLNELMSARSLLQGQEQLIEPLTLRQTHAQFLTMGWRSKKDPYSRASLTNDVAYGTCKTMAEATPDFVVF